jgi:hypothetical protein
VTNKETVGANLTSHPNPFTPLSPSSGAILVGGGAAPRAFVRPGDVIDVPRSRLSFSNYGTRLDVQAWGQAVFTTGIRSDLTNNVETCDGYNGNGPGESNRCYTRSYSGTSSASAIIAGVCASVQGALNAAGRAPLTSENFNQLFRNPLLTQAQPSGLNPAIQRIGDLPDLARLYPAALALSRPRT